MFFLKMESPLGPLTLCGDASHLAAVLFPDEVFNPADHQAAGAGETALHTARAQLEEYFQGRRRMFELPLRPAGTSFQKQVWELLRAIPFGTTTSYGKLAESVGNPRAARAVGAANGRNPLPIIVPCHRVIGATGQLTGFGGGLPAKRWLLTHEGAL